MPLAPGLLVRTLARPGGRLVTVVTRRRRIAGPASSERSASSSRSVEAVQEKPYRAPPVPACDMIVTTGFSRPVARALAALGKRASPAGGDGVSTCSPTDGSAWVTAPPTAT